MFRPAENALKAIKFNAIRLSFFLFYLHSFAMETETRFALFIGQIIKENAGGVS